MREDGFKSWLAERGANTQAGRDTRAYAVRTIESNLAALGSLHADLDDAWVADRFEQLRQRIKDIQQDFRTGGTDYRILMPQSEKPENRLASWRSWLGQYGQFLDGTDSTDRQNAALQVLVNALTRKEIEAAIALCDDEGLEEFLATRGCRTPRRWIVQDDPLRKHPAKAVVISAITFLPDGMELTAKTFFGGYGETEAFARLTALGFALSAPDEQDVIDRFRTNTDFARAERRWTKEQRAAFLQLAEDVHAAGLDWWFVDIDHTPVRFGRKGRGSARARAVIGYVRARDAHVDISTRQTVVPGLPAETGFALEETDMQELGNAVLASTDAIARVLPNTPARNGLWPNEIAMERNPPMETESDSLVPAPTNLVLYGPPGTGKTYATAREAVRLCGEPAPQDRAELMKLYGDLVREKRISFVTFHQNFAYEDFVEGLRPLAENAEGSSGFTLEPHDGVFKQIAQKCRPLDIDDAEDTGHRLEGRRFYKLSLGEHGNKSTDWVLEDSIANGYALFSFGCIDWTDARYGDPDEILRHAQQVRQEETLSRRNGIVKCTHIFRNELQDGDVLIVSKGMRAYCAIGIVRGGYEYHPRAEGNYCHRRNVEWLWHDRAGRAVETISQTIFARDTIYPLGRAEALDIAYLESLVDAAQGAQPAATAARTQAASLPHVLIIDEINRANISKVFGELITLLEPDKRLGMPNALTVRLPYSKTEFGVPANLHIIGTMNTADRSIALLDTALRRRFIFREMAPEPALLGTVEDIDLRAVLTTINARIEYLVDREHRIGHAFFIHCKTRDDVNAVMRDKVIPLLQEYFFEDWSRIAAVVGPGFIRKTELKAPPAFADLPPRPKWSVLTEFPRNAYDHLVHGAVVSAIEGEDTPE